MCFLSLFNLVWSELDKNAVFISTASEPLLSTESLGKGKRDKRRTVYTVCIVTASVGTSGVGLIMRI